MPRTSPLAASPQSPFHDAKARDLIREQKREAIMLAAVRMFNERGFHATSLEDVAARLGITKPVVYHYLGKRERVLFECVRRGLAQLLQAVETARSSPG